jgi:two-component sensor histidine kinase/DNA-binding NarL/FixJ family response regulator
MKTSSTVAGATLLISSIEGCSEYEENPMDTEPVVEKPGRILIADDSAANLRLLAGILAESGYSVREASDGAEALRLARSELPDLILLDVMMPFLDGFKVCQFLKSDAATRDIPVVFMTSLTETRDKIKGFQMGAADYIPKPFQSEEILARVKTLLSLHAMRKRLEARNAELLRTNDELASVNSALSREITERKLAEEALKQYRESLEVLVKERTHELARTNASLKAEIAERERAEEQVRASLREKEILLKEIHHRVKNNLQIISTLLDLQSDHILDEQSLRFFRDSQDRIKSMALIHEKLYQTRDFISINFGEYIANLVKYLFSSYVTDPGRIALVLDVAPATLEIDQAIPFGLIVNELVSNSLKYAFPGERRGAITVSLRTKGDDGIELQVKDNGVGLPPGLDIENTDSLGLQLVFMLVRQIGGEIERGYEGGTSFTIRCRGELPE